ncbi:hypothetical protein ACIQNU_02540 [Streptomyces sp. NPDC091292]|uniref:hypothetical protein n=1 Tax=Streptomyces sp. NPDC091292 TaxID=3365991 RepID=UPI00382E9625
MPDTFGGTWNRPRQDGTGRSARDLQDRASYDNQPQSGCGAVLLLLVAVVIGAVICG